MPSIGVPALAGSLLGVPIASGERTAACAVWGVDTGVITACAAFDTGERVLGAGKSLNEGSVCTVTSVKFTWAFDSVDARPAQNSTSDGSMTPTRAIMIRQ